MGLPSFSMKRPVLTAMVFIAVIILGLISITRLRVELYQGQNQGIVSIVVRARGGLPSQDVEKMITKPIEEVVATVSHLKNLYSSSREAESRVTMEFEAGTNMNFAALEIREKFARVKPLLPDEIEKPVIANYDDAQAAILVFAVTSETLNPEEIRDIVDNKLKPILSRVDGVASVEVYGGRERKILIELDRDKMFAYNVSIERVMDVLGQSNINLLAGSVDRGTYEFAVRTMGAFVDVDEIGDLGVQATRQGSIIPLKEIATIKDAYLEATDHARLNLEQNVTVYVKKTSLSNTLRVAKYLNSVLDEFEESFKNTLSVVIVNDKADTIDRAIGDVKQALYIGLILTVLVIYLFMRKFVLAFIVLVSIPCSIIATFVAMAAFGISINIMTLSGLALAMGILVDSAVVVMENIFSKKEMGYSDGRAIREGSEEVWLPLLASMATTLVVFLPIIFIDKKIQLIYGGLAFTITFSLIASFFVALMLIPMLIKRFAQGKLSAKGVSDRPKILAPMERSRKMEASGFIKKVKGLYKKLMEKNIALRYPIVLAFAVLLAFSIFKLKNMDIDWPTTFEENEFAIISFPLAGARLEANDEAMQKIEDILSETPDIIMFSTTVSKDDLRLFVRLKPKRKRQFSKEEIMEMIDEKGNAAIKEIHDDYSLIVDEGASSSEQKKLVINIFGHEGDVLEKLAKEFADKMSNIKGLINLVMTDLRKRPEYSLVVDRGRAATYGVSVRQVADSMHAQVRGMRPTKFHELSEGLEIETITRLQAIYRQKLDDLQIIHVATDENTQIPISEIANFYPSVGPQTIDRKDKYRYVFVKGDTKRAIETIAKEVKAAVKDVELPDDYYWRFGGGYEELIQSRSQLSIALILTMFLVYMVMACLFQNYTLPLLIMITVPMAAIGVWLSLFITKKPLSQQVFVGMILLAGYVVNAAILLTDRITHLRKEGHPLKAAVSQAGLDRLRPIMMTACSTGLGFMPLALAFGQSSDLWSPLAITVIGGLITSTILTLFILPNFIIISGEMGDIVVSIRKFFANLLHLKTPLRK